MLTEILLTGRKGNHPEQWVELVLIINDEQELVIIANNEYLGRKDFKSNGRIQLFAVVNYCCSNKEVCYKPVGLLVLGIFLYQ